jgi:hypothetical protein
VAWGAPNRAYAIDFWNLLPIRNRRASSAEFFEYENNEPSGEHDGLKTPMQIEKETMMKRILLAVMTALVLTATISEANALVCAAGVVRAGCVGRHGAVAVRRPVVPVHRHCFMRAGVRVCR